MDDEEKATTRRSWIGWLWGRRPPPPVAPPDAVDVLRRIIEPCDGAERAMVELLAEEEGVPWARVRRTIDRLCLAGRIRSDRGEDGIVRLTWIDRREGR
jgi:hypothetical protein